jgi:hypothetical protein
MAKTRLLAAKPSIEAYFAQSPLTAFRRSEIIAMVEANRASWRLPKSMSFSDFFRFMTEKSQLKRVALKFPSRCETRFVFGEIPVYAVAYSLKPDSYFTHYTAMHIHHLTDQVPKTIYLNSEQPPKLKGSGSLSQVRIDAAFRRPPRASKSIATVTGFRICLLNGMHTGGLGVTESTAPDGSAIRVTGLERTLIDIAVRPFYAGGVFEILRAYRKTGGEASVNKISAMLKTLEYVYPYHQAIGYYLEASGYPQSAIALLDEFPKKHDFYLTHQIKNPAYSPKWRLYFPKGL